jgi:hypothetical protein
MGSSCIITYMDYLTEPIFANIKISFKRNENKIYQTIRINPNKPNHLKYFTQEKYRVGRTVHDMLQELYIGDGENIMFEDRKSFKNNTIIRYRLDHEVDIDLSNQEYHVEGNRPKYDSCDGCAFLIRSKKGADRCKFYRKFLPRHKKSCQEFREKGGDVGEL